MEKKQAIEAFGSAKALADALGITEGAVSNWGDKIPELRQYQIRVILAERGQ
jgi:DNA-binding transcriptional regulator YdaS (Cro superfamily)